ncbi:MAG: hypothetical protein ABSB15_10975 [Bryobacteraceae bacterium]
MSGAFSLSRAGRWFLHSGIQEASGGVARFYFAEFHKNKPVSTEITGYAASALVFLYSTTGEECYLDGARRMVNFLCEHAWDAGLQTFPFEHPCSSTAYFFDSGIIVRALLAVWRVTRDYRLLETAIAASRGMIDDFHSGSDYHPILQLPAKKPAARTATWSQAPGCYQVKAALAWWELAEITGEQPFREAWEEILEVGLHTHRDFLPGTADHLRVMDRLHAYTYFLEAMWQVLDRPACVEAYRYGLETVSCYLREIAPQFARSDVYAQLLRARIYGAKVIPVDRAAAAEEAEALEEFQVVSEDRRIDGAWLFGRRDGKTVLHANPVSTAFAIQALEVWRAFEAGETDPCRQPPI